MAQPQGKRIEIRLVPLILTILIICALVFVLFFKVLPMLNSDNSGEDLSIVEDEATNTLRSSSNSAKNELSNTILDSTVITNDDPNGIKKEINCKVDSVLDLKIYHLNNNDAEAEIVSNDTEMYITGLEINKKYKIQNLENVKDVYCYTTGDNSDQVCIFLLKDGTVKLLDYTKLNSSDDKDSIFIATNTLEDLSNVTAIAQQAVIGPDGSGSLAIFAKTSDSDNMINITNKLKTARELGLCG